MYVRMLCVLRVLCSMYINMYSMSCRDCLPRSDSRSEASTASVKLFRLFRLLACRTPTARYAIRYRLTARRMSGSLPDSPRWQPDPQTYSATVRTATHAALSFYYEPIHFSGDLLEFRR